jgi:MoxR-like ATPase
VLADEINRATPKTQSALLEAMQEKQVTAGGEIRKLELPFFVMATQNPLEQEGTYPLPEAQLDRFFYKLLVQYSGRDELHKIMAMTTKGRAGQDQPILDGPTIMKHQHLIRQVVIAPHVAGLRDPRARWRRTPTGMYAIPMTNQFPARRRQPPRRAGDHARSKVRALLDGRFHVSFKDIKDVASPPCATASSSTSRARPRASRRHGAGKDPRRNPDTPPKTQMPATAGAR